ncbi:MAG TPA: VOC family protein [Solirubrobacterales bacterium]|nr:VOC family protein [Solirubrobacterales bacterium]
MQAPATRFLNPAYRVAEIARSLAFYGAIGFEERGRHPGPKDATHILLGLPAEVLPRLQLIHRPEAGPYKLGNGYSHLSLQVGDLEAVLQRLATLGAQPNQSPYHLEGPESPLFCTIRDPDGYWILLIGRDDEPAPDPNIEVLIREEVARREEAIEPASNRVLPSSDDIGREGVEALWAERFPKYPRVRHDGHSTLRVRVPPEQGVGEWLRGNRHRKPKLVKEGPWWWEMSYSWLDEIIAQLAYAYGGVLVFRDFANVEKCASACVKARSSVTSCECSCGGLYHGTGALPVGFHVISEALAIRVSETEEVTVSFIRPRNGVERLRMGLL